MTTTLWRSAALAGAVIALAGGSSAAVIGKGRTAPAWKGKTLAGKTLSSTQLKGKAILMNFFSYT